MKGTTKYYVAGHSGMTRHLRGRFEGKGASVLLNTGGAGSGSSYDSVEDYMTTTGRTLVGRGASLNQKLQSLSLSVKPPKTKVKNIKFNL